tara:strand:+ start:875 stop:1507 length:633 start_codon:yes stop_codon:yes gene_type:complete
MEQLLHVILPSIASAIFSGILIKISLSLAKQTWSNNYQYTLICLLLPIITFVITKVISNNIALSLGMVGALSIVRFRNPVKNSLELVIYFALIAIGIASGVNPKYAILLGLLVSFLIIILNYSAILLKKLNVDFFSFSHNEKNDFHFVEINSDMELNYNKYSENLENMYSDLKNKKFFYRFTSKDKKKIKEIYENFKSLDNINSIDIKYE